MARPIGRFGGGDGQHEEREDLTDEIAEEGREGDEVDVDGEQDQLDRHQDDDDVLAVDEDAEDAEREQDRGDGQVVGEADGHQIPFPDSTLRTSIAVAGVASDLLGDRLALDVGPVAERQHDRADHGDEQHHARGLEEVDVAGVEDLPERLGVGDARRPAPAAPTVASGANTQPPRTISSSARSTMPISAADRQVVEEALAELDEIDVEHHHHEQEEHRDRADIDDDQDHRQELGAEQHEQAGGVDEGEDQEQHRVHGIARADHHHRRRRSSRRRRDRRRWR